MLISPTTVHVHPVQLDSGGRVRPHRLPKGPPLRNSAQGGNCSLRSSGAVQGGGELDECQPPVPT